MLTKVEKYSIHNNLPYAMGVVIHIDGDKSIVAKFVGRQERVPGSNQYYDSNIVLLTSEDNKYLTKEHYEHEEIVYIRCQYNGTVDGPDEIEWIEVSPRYEIVRQRNIDSTSLQKLDEFLITTPKEELERIKNEFFSDEVNEYYQGPTVDDYFEAISGGVSRQEFMSFVNDILTWISIKEIKYDTHKPGSGEWYHKNGEGLATSNEELIHKFIEAWQQ